MDETDKSTIFYIITRFYPLDETDSFGLIIVESKRTDGGKLRFESNNSGLLDSVLSLSTRIKINLRSEGPITSGHH